MVVLGKEQQDDTLHPHSAHLQGEACWGPSAYSSPTASASAPLPPYLSTPAIERPSSLSEMGAEIQKGPSSHKGVCCYQHEVERSQCVHEELAPLVGKESILEPLVDHGIDFLQPGR